MHSAIAICEDTLPEDTKEYIKTPEEKVTYLIGQLGALDIDIGNAERSLEELKEKGYSGAIIEYSTRSATTVGGFTL